MDLAPQQHAECPADKSVIHGEWTDSAGRTAVYVFHLALFSLSLKKIIIYLSVGIEIQKAFVTGQFLTLKTGQ